MTIDLWRSELMQLVQLIIPSDAAHETIAELGALGLLEFKDLNPDTEPFSRTYASQVKRCNEMARRLRFLYEQVTGAELPMQSASAHTPMPLDELESKLEELEKELTVINENNERLKKSNAELVELQLVLEKAGDFFDEARRSAAGGDASYDVGSTGSGADAPLLDDAPGSAAMQSTRLGFTAGTIDMESLNSFERLLFRATRGNMFLRSCDVGTVIDPNTNKPKNKAVFVVFYAGERAKLKITKETSRQRQMHQDVTARLLELSRTMEAGDTHRMGVLRNISNFLQSWITTVRREKAVYHTLNMLSFDVTRQALVAEAWMPLDARGAVTAALQRGTELSNATVGSIFQPLATHATPPTYFKTTKFTDCFQTIVAAYGVARYREVNPTTFTLITFPFLFAVMFGDVGHATLMVAFASFIISMERALSKQQLDDITTMMFGGRYIILLMGVFSIFTGFMYNEFFSMPMAIAGGTHYRCQRADGSLVYFRECAAEDGTGDPSVYDEGLVGPIDGPYPFGVDPVWHGTRTELSFMNAVKMKMSIVMGVVHMSVGIFMSAFNHVYFRDYLSLVCEFIPQILFMWSLFGYLMFLIIFKWVAWPYMEERSIANSATGVGRPPDLYGIMINMFLKPTDITDGGNADCNDIYDGQMYIQIGLVLLALVAIPWMLLPKPLLLKRRYERRHVQGYATVGGQEPGDLEAGGHAEPDAHGHGEHFEFGEVIVHQTIHTIEFVLGSVSNTASYLRLWALSLAHSQLSAVIYDKILMMTVSSNSPVMLVVGVFSWFIATLVVLMIMESLSAFLHALRLHWVEFQNKFYHGDGDLFTPFDFAEVDKDETFFLTAA